MSTNIVRIDNFKDWLQLEYRAYKNCWFVEDFPNRISINLSFSNVNNYTILYDNGVTISDIIQVCYFIVKKCVALYYLNYLYIYKVLLEALSDQDIEIEDYNYELFYQSQDISYCMESERLLTSFHLTKKVII